MSIFSLLVNGMELMVSDGPLIGSSVVLMKRGWVNGSAGFLNSEVMYFNMLFMVVIVDGDREVYLMVMGMLVSFSSCFL